MHEYSIVSALLHQVERHAAEHGAIAVHKLRVQIGELAGVDPALLQSLVAAAFSQRRKLLRHALGRWLEERGYDGAFDMQRRAEEVPVYEYVALAQQLGAALPTPAH